MSHATNTESRGVENTVSLILRFRRPEDEVREQIQRIAFAASFVGLAYLII